MELKDCKQFSLLKDKLGHIKISNVLARTGMTRLDIVLQNEKLLVQLLVKALAWVAGSVPGWGA